MEFKSQICTTEKQSKRLLALGLKKETADMFHYQWSEGIWGIEARIPYTHNERMIPAWSLHRLIEIVGELSFVPNNTEDWYDAIIAHIQSLIHIGYINKEYLDMDIVTFNSDLQKPKGLFRGSGTKTQGTVCRSWVISRADSSMKTRLGRG